MIDQGLNWPVVLDAEPALRDIDNALQNHEVSEKKPTSRALERTLICRPLSVNAHQIRAFQAELFRLLLWLRLIDWNASPVWGALARSSSTSFLYNISCKE